MLVDSITMSSPFSDFYLGLPQPPSRRAYDPRPQETRILKRDKLVRRAVRRRKNRVKRQIKELTLGSTKKLAFDPKRFKEVLDGLYGTGRYVISLGDYNYTLNENTYQRLRRYLNPDGTIVDTSAYETGSDEALIQTITRVPFFEVTRKFQTRRPTPRGSFFPWFHQVEGLDLSELQIYTEDTYQYDIVNNENCFITALKSAGIETQMIEQMCRGREIPQKIIKSIAEEHDLYITVRSAGAKDYLKHYGKRTSTPISMGLVENHYFIIKQIPITSWALNNYSSELIEDAEWKNLYKPGKHSDNRFIDSFKVVKILLKNHKTLLKPLDRHTLLHTIYQNKNTELEDITINTKNLKKNKQLKKKDNEDDCVNVFFDFETATQGRHIPYLCRCDVINKVWLGPDCGKYMLNDLVKEFPGKCLRLLAHNASYDIKFIFKYLGQVKTIQRGKNLLRATARFMKTKIIVQDTYAHIAMKLSDFGKTFKIPVSKEIIPYDLYTARNIKNRYLPLNECIDGVDIQYMKMNIGKPKTDEAKHELRRLFIQNCDKWDCKTIHGIDIIKYSSEYCKMDCEVLKQGYNKFRGWLLEITKLDVDDYVSLPSIANDAYNKCFKDVYQVKNVVREYIFQAMVGGRTMLNSNEKSKSGDVLDDFDAVSLYPSAMFRLGGYLKGKPKELDCAKLNMDFLNSCDGYVVDINITKVGKDRHFPLSSIKNDKDIRVFTNDLVGSTKTVDKVSLEDLVNFQGVEYDLVRGYYWNEGRNMELKDTIDFYFNERVKQKKAKNPIQSVYKLLMNSAYGKTMIKPFESDNKIVSGEDKESFISTHYNQILEMCELHNGSHQIKVLNVIDSHFNNVICGVEVLSMSKRIMNEVMCLAEDLGIFVAYQDTDSMHIKRGDIPTLSKAYQEKYSRDLIGSGMGQFHSDFNSDVITGDSIHASQSIFVAKKTYIDQLEGVDAKGIKQLEYHIRMKGCSNESILWWCEQNVETPMDLYQRLYDGEKIELDQTCGGNKICFDYTKDWWVQTKDNFKRNIKF